METLYPPYHLRVIALLLFIACIVTWDLLRSPRGSTRLKEYSFLLGCGLAAAAFGVLNDQITCSISPDYFILGKNIPDGDGFRYRIASLGAKAGFSAGIAAGAIYLFANTVRSPGPTVSYRSLAFLTCKPVTSAIAFAVVGGFLFPSVYPPRLTTELDGALTDRQTSAFVTVWGVHIGLYFGLAAGLVWGVWTIRGMRPESAPAQQSVESLQERLLNMKPRIKSILDEWNLLEECLSHVEGYSAGDFEKVEEESKPDFQHRSKALWVEVTKIRETEGPYQDMNDSLDRFCRQLRHKLKEILPDWGLLIVTVTPKRGQKPSRAERRLEEMAQLVRKRCGEGQNTLNLSEDLPGKLADEFHWIGIRQSDDTLEAKDIRVIPNMLLNDFEHVPDRIQQAINSKETKKYRDKIPDDELWLVVEAPCMKSELNMNAMAGTASELFKRVYVVFGYDPEMETNGCERVI